MTELSNETEDDAHHDEEDETSQEVPPETVHRSKGNFLEGLGFSQLFEQEPKGLNLNCTAKP